VYRSTKCRLARKVYNGECFGDSFQCGRCQVQTKIGLLRGSEQRRRHAAWRTMESGLARSSLRREGSSARMGDISTATTKISLNCHEPSNGGVNSNVAPPTPSVRPPELFTHLPPRGTVLRVLLLADETSFGRVPRPSISPIPHRRWHGEALLYPHASSRRVAVPVSYPRRGNRGWQPGRAPLVRHRDHHRDHHQQQQQHRTQTNKTKTDREGGAK
jgi:hypothetical protein